MVNFPTRTGRKRGMEKPEETLRSKKVFNYGYFLNEFTPSELDEVAAALLLLNPTSPKEEEEDNRCSRLQLPRWGRKGRRTDIDVTPPSSPKPLRNPPALYRTCRLEPDVVNEKIPLPLPLPLPLPPSSSSSLSPKTPLLFSDVHGNNNNLVVGEKDTIFSFSDLQARKLRVRNFEEDNDNNPTVATELTLALDPTPTIPPVSPVAVDSINNHQTPHIHNQNSQCGRFNVVLDYNYRVHHERGDSISRPTAFDYLNKEEVKSSDSKQARQRRRELNRQKRLYRHKSSIL